MTKWKTIPGLDSKYKASSDGKIYSLFRKGRLISPFITKDGYERVVLQVKGVRKHFFVHRLVAMAFIPNPNNLPYINHKDEVKNNNRVENLEWCTKLYNNNYGSVKEKYKTSHINHKELSTPVLCLKDGVVIGEYPSLSEAERQTGISEPNILKCCQNKRHTAGGFGWSYKYGRKKPLIINYNK